MTLEGLVQDKIERVCTGKRGCRGGGGGGSCFETGCLLQIYRLGLADGVYFSFSVTAFTATAAEPSSAGYFSQCIVSWREDFISDLKSNLCVTCATPRNQGKQTVAESYCYCFSQLRRGR